MVEFYKVALEIWNYLDILQIWPLYLNMTVVFAVAMRPFRIVFTSFATSMYQWFSLEPAWRPVNTCKALWVDNCLCNYCCKEISHKNTNLEC